MSETMLDGLKERIFKAAKIHQSIGIIVPMNNYSDLSEAMFSYMLDDNDDIWIYLMITKSYDTMVKRFKGLAEHKNIKFIDCISRAAGITRTEKGCVYIDSPVMLEKMIIEIMHLFHESKPDVNKYLILDSISALMIYNNPETVKEFFQHLVNKSRAENMHSISIVLEEELNEYMNKIIFLNDKIIKVKESFI